MASKLTRYVYPSKILENLLNTDEQKRMAMNKNRGEERDFIVNFM